MFSLLGVHSSRTLVGLKILAVKSSGGRRSSSSTETPPMSTRLVTEINNDCPQSSITCPPRSACTSTYKGSSNSLFGKEKSTILLWLHSLMLSAPDQQAIKLNVYHIEFSRAKHILHSTILQFLCEILYYAVLLSTWSLLYYITSTSSNTWCFLRFPVEQMSLASEYYCSRQQKAAKSKIRYSLHKLWNMAKDLNDCGMATKENDKA